jgi:hypothetical protein
MSTTLEALEELDSRLIKTAQSLFLACEASLYPADLLAIAVANRALCLLNSFLLLIRNGGYIAAAGILRMQLDNVLRLGGVIATADPHDVANQLINGTALAKIKDSQGEKMRDARLRKVVAARLSWVDKTYSLSSDYIHLSKQHILHVLQRSPFNADGHRELEIGSDDAYLDDDQREDLIAAFQTVTLEVITTIEAWKKRPVNNAEKERLQQRYKNAV